MYRGMIIEESLRDRSVLSHVKITKTDVETVTPEHKTPWLTQWTIDVVEIEDDEIAAFAQQLQGAIETEHTAWYADFKNTTEHYIIFPSRIFHIDRAQPKQYDEVVTYGMSLGIPEHQLTFSSEIE